MPDAHVTVSSQTELRRKLEAFGELFGPPKKVTIGPSRGKSFIALVGGEDIWGSVDLMSFSRTKVQLLIDGKLELASIDWSQNQKP